MTTQTNFVIYRSRRLPTAAAACAAVFAGISTAVTARWTPLLNLDDNGVRAANSATTKAYRGFLSSWGAVFSPTDLLYVGLLLAVVLLFRRRWRQAAATAVLTVGGNYLVEGLKSAFGRPRPNLHHTLARSTGFSFPSHHAAMATLVSGLLVLAVLPELRRPVRRARPVLVGAAATVALFTAYSRVALADHYPSDVVAGCALGFVLVAVAAVVARWESRRLTR